MRILFLLIVLAVMGCEKDIITDLTVRNQAFNGTLYVDSVYMAGLDLGSSYTFPIDPGMHQIDLNSKYLFHNGSVKSDKVLINKGHNTHIISLCADCH